MPAFTKSGKVLFDGYRKGRLLDAQDWEEWPPVNIEWHFPSEDKANAVLALFQSRGIREIEVKLSRKARP